jgi:hypothetical protein
MPARHLRAAQYWRPPRLPPRPVVDDDAELLEPLPVLDIECSEEQLNAVFGINDLADIEGTDARTVKLSERSTAVCPAHGFVLQPDACRSCSFLAGDF